METICLSCGNTKAKRWCPALNNQICSLCCGKKRTIEINCPQNCPYLVKGEFYELQKTNQKEILEKEIPILISGEEFLKRYVDPKKPTKIDNFVFEVANLTGAIVNNFLPKISNLFISPKILIDQLVNNIIPLCYEKVNRCYSCEVRCPINYIEDGSALFEKQIFLNGITIEDFPEELAEQTLGDFFAVRTGGHLVECFENEINKLNQEDKLNLSKEQIYDIKDDFYWAIIVFIADCFYCDNECLAKPKENGICCFCQNTDRYKNLCIYGSEPIQYHLFDKNRRFKTQRLPLFKFLKR
ncbi:MAG: hypothetical protein AB1422_06290 [bacterium]